jgi:hypothetical protein
MGRPQNVVQEAVISFVQDQLEKPLIIVSLPSIRQIFQMVDEVLRGI